MNTVSQKPIKGISPIFITYVFGFIDVLLRFWGKRSKVKVTADKDPETL